MVTKNTVLRVRYFSLPNGLRTFLWAQMRVSSRLWGLLWGSTGELSSRVHRWSAAVISAIFWCPSWPSHIFMSTKYCTSGIHIILYSRITELIRYLLKKVQNLSQRVINGIEMPLFIPSHTCRPTLYICPMWMLSCQAWHFEQSCHA